MAKTSYELGELAARVSGLWREVWEQTASTSLASTLSGIAEAHRQLVTLDASLPATTTAGRHRRRCLEALQSEATELEAQLAKVSTAASELNALATRQLTVARDALVDAPSSSRFDGAPRAHWLVSLGLVVAAGLLLARSPGQELFACGLTIIALLLRVYERYEFDGRSLTVRKRIFDSDLLGCRLKTDLSVFNRVKVTMYEVEVGNHGGSVTHARIELLSPDAEVMVVDEAAGTATCELDRHLGEWCAAATRDAS